MNAQLVVRIRVFGTTNYSSFYAKRFADGNEGLGNFWKAEELEAVPHVIDAIHFFIAGSARFLNRLEDGGNGKELIFYVMNLLAEAQAFTLPATRTVNHSSDTLSVPTEHLFDYGSIGSSWTE